MAYEVHVPGGDLHRKASANVSAVTYSGNPPAYASGGIPAGYCVIFDTGTGLVDDVAIAGAAALIAGVAGYENVAYGPGDEIPCQIAGVAKCVAGGAIAVGDQLSTDSSGRVVDAAALAATTANVVGIAQTTASEAGDYVSVLLTIGSTTVANA